MSESTAPLLSDHAPVRVRRIAGLLGAAVCCGLAANAVGIPAGGLFGGLAGALIVNLLSPGPRLPHGYSEAAKTLLGAVVGSTTSLSVLLALGPTLAPAALAVVGLVVASTGLSFFLHRFQGLDTQTALFACMPGGLAELSLTADQLGARTPVVIAVHTVRVVAVLLIFPLVVAWLVT